MSSTSVLFAMMAIIFSFLNNVSCTVQSFIPLARNGYAFHRGNTSALTTVELFLDLTCPTCQAGWPLYNELYDLYKSKVHFEYRVYPLPHHPQCFLMAQAAQVVNVYGSSPESVFTFIGTAFENLDAIVGTKTNAMSYDEVVTLVSGWATKETGVSTAEYYNGMNTSTTVGNQCSVDARNMWKFNAINGMFQTPLYRIDGLLIGGLKTLDDWKATLDPLVA